MQIMFDNIEIPEKELNDVVNENLKKIGDLQKKRRKRKVIGGCAAAAVLMAAGFGFGISNPVMASQIPLIGHLFEKVQDKQMYAGDYKKDAQPVQGENVSEAEGIKVTLSEMYCNTEALNVSVLIESKEAFPEGVRAGDEKDGDKTISRMFLDAQQGFSFTDEKIDEQLMVNGEFLDDHTFAGAFRIDFNIGVLSITEIPETFEWKLHVNRIQYSNEIGNDEALTSDCIWDFSTEVTMDTEKSVTKEINQYAPTGQGVGTVTKTPYEIILNEQYNEEKRTEEGGYQYVILDADGNYLPDKVGMIAVRGYNVSKITIYYYPLPEDKEDVTVTERIHSGNEGLEEYIKGISVYQIEVNFDE